MAQPETRLVQRIVRALSDKWPMIWYLKVHGGPMQRSGVPDLLVCIEGKLVGMEVKLQAPGETAEHARERATADQRWQMYDLRECGAVAGVVLSVEEAIELVSAALEDMPTPEWATVEPQPVNIEVDDTGQ